MQLVAAFKTAAVVWYQCNGIKDNTCGKKKCKKPQREKYQSGSMSNATQSNFDCQDLWVEKQKSG